jgi:hypothetical protein
MARASVRLGNNNFPICVFVCSFALTKQGGANNTKHWLLRLGRTSQAVFESCMVMFGWLLGKGTKHKAGHKAPSASNRASAARLMDAGDSVFPDADHETGQPKSALEEAADRAMQQRREQRKADRMGRREALFGIVREIMLRSGILSSAYKFKVLSIDQKGRHFLVLLDLSMDLAQSEPAERLLEIEKMIAETAMARMQVVVQAVYWRHFVQGQAATVRLSSGDTQPGGLSTHIGIDNHTAAAPPQKARKPQDTSSTRSAADNSAADAISTALAELRAKNRAKTQERTAEQQPSVEFATTQVINRARIAAADDFAATRMQADDGNPEADTEELAAFQRALQGNSSHPPRQAEDDYPASIFVSGKAIDSHGELAQAGSEEHFVDGGIDLSGTQYGELPKF